VAGLAAETAEKDDQSQQRSLGRMANGEEFALN
jgi:hypothetical protein